MAPVPTGAMSSFGTYVEGMRAVDLEHLPDRATAEATLAPFVPDPVIRSFLLQNLRRDGEPLALADEPARCSATSWPRSPAGPT